MSGFTFLDCHSIIADDIVTTKLKGDMTSSSTTVAIRRNTYLPSKNHRWEISPLLLYTGQDGLNLVSESNIFFLSLVGLGKFK